MAASRIGATAEANVMDAGPPESRQVTIKDDALRRIAELLHQGAGLAGQSR